MYNICMNIKNDQNIDDKKIDEFINDLIVMEKKEQFSNSPTDRKRKIKEILKNSIKNNNDN